MKYRLKKEDKRLLILILLPVVLYLFAVQGSNFLWSIRVSLTNESIGHSGNFVWFKNFLDLFKENIYWDSMLFTLVYSATAVTFKLIFGTLLALTLNRPLIGKNVYRSLLFLPWALPIFTSALTWRWMFGDIGGVINYLLMQVGIIDYPLGWLGVSNLARISVIIVNIWRGIPFFAITVLATLQSIPMSIYEAAHIDGATAWKSFWRITLPNIKSVVILVSLVSTIWTLGDFSIIWLMTRGGPANSTHVFSTYSYIVAFQNLNISKGVSISLSIVPFSILFMLFAMKYIFSSEN